MSNKKTDILIIGGGVAGLVAGMYASRNGYEALIVEREFAGGQIVNTYEVENFPGMLEATSGFEWAENVRKQTEKFGTKIIYSEITKIEKIDNKIIAKTTDEDIEAKTLIIATGAKPRMLGVKGEEEFRGRGVSYCATCDGAFYRDKVVAVIGGGDTALEDALFLSKFAKKVYIVHRRDQYRGEQILIDKLEKEAKITPVLDTVINEIQGENFVNSINVTNVKTKAISNIEVDGVFVAIGVKPINDLFSELIPVNKGGYIETGDDMQTNIKGIFAAGDIRQKALLQLVTAASDGAIASIGAQRYILEND